MQSKSAETAFDTQVEALGHVTRRRLLHELLKNPVGVVDVEDARQGGCSAVSVQHVHLPKLEEMGYVTPVSGGEHVKRGPRFDDIAPLLELLDTHDEELSAEWL